MEYALRLYYDFSLNPIDFLCIKLMKYIKMVLEINWYTNATALTINFYDNQNLANRYFYQ